MDLTEAEDIKKRWQKYILLGISFFESPSKYIDDSLIFFFQKCLLNSKLFYVMVYGIDI